MKRIIIEYNGELTERLIFAVMEVLNPIAAENGKADEKLNRFTIQYEAEDSESLTRPLLMAAMKARKLNHMEALKGCTEVYLDNGGEFKCHCTESTAEDDTPAGETEEMDYYDSMFYYYRNLEKEAFDGKASDDNSSDASGHNGGQNHEENNN